MEIEEIKALMTHLEESKLKKLVFKRGDFELHLEKEGFPVLAPRRAVAQESLPEPAVQSEPPQTREAPAGTYVTSPMVGTHYSSPAPDQPSFVKVGDIVNENTVVCIIEAMKVMNEVKAGVSGTVAEILAADPQPVEFGTRLLRIV